MIYRLTTFDALALGALMMVPQVAESATSSKFEVSAGRVNPTAQGQMMSAGYLTLRNPTSRVETVVAASSPAAEAVEVHLASMTGGVMRMRKVGSLSIPAGGEVRFQPGGYHLMINNPRSRLVAGTTFPLDLHMASGRKIRVMMRVAPLGGDESKGGKHEHR